MRRFGAVVAWSLDRIGRSALDILDAVEDFERRGIRLLLTKDSLETSGPTGRLVVTVLAGVAQLERDLIAERTRVGLAAARRRGARIGRPRAAVDTATLDAVNRGELSIAAAARKLGVSAATVNVASGSAFTRDKTGGGQRGRPVPSWAARTCAPRV